MANKPFAIQGSDLTLGGVNLSAGATTIVIPGVTQAADYFVEEVDERDGSNPIIFGSNANAVTIIDNADYVYRSGGAQPSGDYASAGYSVDELDDGQIEEINVENQGIFLTADKTRAEAANMWATTTPTPFASFNAANWTQIPFRPKMRAGAVENVGGGSGGVVERSIEFPAGEEGDTAGTLALIPNGELYLCTTDWFDYSEYGGEYSGLVTTGEFLPSQTGNVSNAAFILRVDVPPEILYILQSAAIVPGDWEIAMADAGFGGTYTCTDVTFDVDNNPVFFWPYRSGTDPVGITSGSAFTVTYNGTVPQPAIWTEIATGGGVGDRLINGLNEVVLDVNGNLTAPGDITTGADGGRFIQDCDDGTTSMRWINVNQGSSSTQLIRVYTGDPDEENDVERAQIKLNWDQTEDKSGLTIRTFDDSDDSTNHDWLFKGDGVLQLPVGGDIVDSTGASVLGVGGGTGGDANIWVQTFETATPATDVPQVVTSVEYDSAGNIIALFNHVDPVDDSAYYSVGKYTTTGTRIWTTGFADDFFTDGWGLAVDNDGGFVYIAGRTSADGGQDNATLTKISGTTGLVEWSKTYDFGYNSSSPVVDVSNTGAPVMVGFAENGDDRYVTTTKIDQTDGTVIWSRALDGQNDEEAYGMAVGPSGEVVAVGYMESFGIQDAADDLYADLAGNLNWTIGGSINSNGVTADFTFAAGFPTFTNIVDTVGGRTVDDVIVTVLGSTIGGVNGVDDMIVKVATVAVNDTDDRMLVVKYAANGTIVWQKAIQFDADFDCSGADADIDSEGNIYVCGQYSADNVDPIGQLMSIVKFNSSGVKQWSRRVVGNCGQWTSSIVVGADDHLYLSATTFTGTDPGDLDIHLVLAKYSFDGLVAWQRLLDYTAGYSFGTNFFGSDIGGSNLAVKQDYVAVGLGFGGEDPFGGPGSVNAAVAQIPASGDVFTVGNWDFKSASFSGVLNNTASDITVVNAGKTDYDNIANISMGTVTLEEDSSNFLIGTLFTAPGGDNSLVNGAYSVTLENTGTLTLPAGGTITEGYVTSNPTIQLTPATPDVASQKLVIKGGGSYDYTDNGININYYTNTAIVGDTLTFYINSSTYAGQTLYWWIYPEGAGISDPGSGTVVLDGSSGIISFVLDSDDNEFTLRVSPEANNYDPASLGVESGLINADAPTFDYEHHLHLTTGDLSETSIFLGTDDHNVRTTTDGGIEITTPNTSNNVWNFDVAGDLNLPDNGGIVFDRNNTTIRVGMGFHIASGEGISLDAIDQTAILTLSGAGNVPVNQTYNKTNDTLYTGNDNSSVTVENLGGTWFVFIDGDAKYTSNDLIGWALSTGPGPVPVGVLSNSYKSWVFSPTGNLTFPDGTTTTGDTVISTSTYDIQSIGNTLIRTNTTVGAKTWTFGTDGSLTLPGAVVKSTVAKTGVILPTITGIAESLTHNSGLTGLTDAQYGPFTLGTVTFSVAVNGGVINNFVSVSSTANVTINDVLGTIDSGDIGGTAGALTITVTVNGVVQATPTALDLTKTVNVIGTNHYGLADGVEGQIMYFVPSSTHGNTSDAYILVSNARTVITGVGMSNITDYSWTPFTGESLEPTTIAMAIFADGAWCLRGGASN